MGIRFILRNRRSPNRAQQNGLDIALAPPEGSVFSGVGGAFTHPCLATKYRAKLQTNPAALAIVMTRRALQENGLPPRRGKVAQ